MRSKGLKFHHYTSCSTPTHALRSLSLGAPRHVAGSVHRQGTQAKGSIGYEISTGLRPIGNEWGPSSNA